MQREPNRTILRVMRHEGGWAVEEDGQFFGHSYDREVAKAHASKRARELHDVHRGCQVRMNGEAGYIGG